MYFKFNMFYLNRQKLKKVLIKPAFIFISLQELPANCILAKINLSIFILFSFHLLPQLTHFIRVVQITLLELKLELN